MDQRQSLRLSLARKSFLPRTLEAGKGSRASILLKESTNWVSRRFNIKTKQNQKPDSGGVVFDVTDAECDEMIEALSSNHQNSSSWSEEVKFLSRPWVKAIMSQPYRKNKKIRRPFDYSKEKIEQYLAWRHESNITDKISHYMIHGDEVKHLKPTIGGADLYWYGVDKEGCPIMWYRADRTNFDVDYKKADLHTALVIQAVLDRMPGDIHKINFVVCLDQYNTFQAMRRPKLGQNSIHTFMKICPDRLKACYFITGGLGSFFFKLVEKLAPQSIMSKVTKCKSRKQAAEFLVSDEVLTEGEVPSFMGGNLEHDEQIIMNYPLMIKKIEDAMKVKCTDPIELPDAFICRGHF